MMISIILPFVVVLICCFIQVQVEASSTSISRIARPLLYLSRKSTSTVLIRTAPYSSSIPCFTDKTDRITQNPTDEYLKEFFLKNSRFVIEDLENGKVDPSIFGTENNITAEPLLILALKENKFVLAATMIEHGVDINISDKELKSPLILAVLKNRLDLVARLLKQPSLRINAPDCHNFTALYYAVKFGYLEIATLLLKAGAAPFTVNNYNEIEVFPCKDLLDSIFNGGSKYEMVNTDPTKKKFLLAFFRAISNGVRTFDALIVKRKSLKISDNLVRFIEHLVEEELVHALVVLRSDEDAGLNFKNQEYRTYFRSSLHLESPLTARNMHRSSFIVMADFVNRIRDNLIPEAAESNSALFNNQFKLLRALVALGVGLDGRGDKDHHFKNNILAFYLFNSRVPDIKTVKYLVERCGARTDYRGVPLCFVALEMYNYPIATFLLNRAISANPGLINVGAFEYFLSEINKRRGPVRKLYPGEAEFNLEFLKLIWE